MQVDYTALIVAFIALMAPLIAGFLSMHMAYKERCELRRKAREDHWRELGYMLVEIRAELQYLHHPPNTANNPELEQRKETLYGKAYGIMLLSGDSAAQGLAEEVMAKPVGDPKLQVINRAIQNFAERADEVMREK